MTKRTGVYGARQAPQATRGQRQPGPGGGRTGGRTGVGRGSMAGAGISRLNGLMMIGGMVGGADGGPFGPLLAKAGCNTARRSPMS